MTALIDLHFLPSLEYFCALQRFEEVCVEKHEHFVKQSYRNRAYINTAQGVEMLSVPLAERHGKIPMSEVRIDYGQRWENHHWRTIESAYRKAPFFEHYESELKSLIYSKKELLYDLNMAILSLCLKSLHWSKKITETSQYSQQIPLSVTDLRGAITPKKSYLERKFYRPAPYYQVFGSTFAENLTLIDLLFCTGPQSSTILRQSQTEPNN
ncbi:MAG: WbqC family protein [Bacteroidota bacterium]